MIQELMTGQEIGADVYIDPLTHEVISIFTKKKILMRAGETDKSVSFKNEKLFEFIQNFVSKSGYLWNIDIDIFEKDGEFYVSEVNPRFGEDTLLNFRELIVGAGRAGRELVVFADAHLGAAVGAAVSSSAGFFSRFANVFHDVTSFCHYYAAQTAALSACPLVKKRKR